MSETPNEGSERSGEYVAEVGFDDLALSEPIRRALAERGYERPTPVQAAAFGPAMEGKDLIVRSKTGTGKTCAFGLPLLERLSPDEGAVRALILCPTRELALQVADELSDLGKHKGVKVAAIYGGASMQSQLNALAEGASIVVGTPGRILDHIRRKNLKLDGCRHAVLDEADEMLNQGFYEEVTRILDTLPDERQVLLFSATVPEDIRRLISQYTQEPETLLLSGDDFTVDHITHLRYDISDSYPKPRNLIYLLEMENPEHAIVFCNTRDDTSLVTAVLNRNGFDADMLNGDLPQSERERVMAKVKRGEVAFMVATDIAARGIDISDLKYVINYSLPEDPAVYLHRVGRTGRIGKTGTAINIVSGRELSTLTTLEKKYGVKFVKKDMPAPEDAMRRWTERHVKEIREASGETVYEGFLELAGTLKGRTDADDLIAFLLKYFFTHHRQERVQSEGSAAGTTERSEPAADRDRGPRDRPRRDRDDRGARSEGRERSPRRERSRAEGEEPRARRPRRDEEGDEGTRERRERRPRPTEVPEGHAKLWVNLGDDNELPEGGLAALLESVGAPAGKVARADLRGRFSFLVVAEEDVPAFEGLSGKTVADQELKIERARPRQR